MAQILVVEDETAQRAAICAYLERCGYTTLGAGDAQQALVMLSHGSVQLVVCDVMLPGENGFDFARRVRAEQPRLPILLVTALGEMENKRQGFDAGADDYMTKPLELDELRLRIGALLRRADIGAAQVVRIGGTCIDGGMRTVTCGTQVMQLPRREFDLLMHLATYPGQVLTRRQLMEAVWGLECESDERTVDVHIARLREHLQENPDFEIATVRGLGYRARVLRHEE